MLCEMYQLMVAPFLRQFALLVTFSYKEFIFTFISLLKKQQKQMMRRVMEILLQSYKSTQYSMRMPLDRRANDPHLDLNLL